MKRILIADDSELVRKQLRVILESHPGWHVCSEAANGQKAILLAQELKPDLVVLDLAMPMLDGFRAAAEIVEMLPSVPIVIYTFHDLPQMELEAKKFGVRAIVPKSADEKFLIQALEGVLPPDTPPALADATTGGAGTPISLVWTEETPAESQPGVPDPPPQAD